MENVIGYSIVTKDGALGQRFDSVEVARAQKVVSDSLYKTMAPHRVVKIVEVE